MTKHFAFTRLEICPGGCDRRGSYTLHAAVDKLVKSPAFQAGILRVQTPSAVPTTSSTYVVVREWLKRSVCKTDTLRGRASSNLARYTNARLVECRDGGLQTRTRWLDSNDGLH